jgi:hypothetical protein
MDNKPSFENHDMDRCSGPGCPTMVPVLVGICENCYQAEASYGSSDDYPGLSQDGYDD